MCSAMIWHMYVFMSTVNHASLTTTKPGVFPEVSLGWVLGYTVATISN